MKVKYRRKDWDSVFFEMNIAEAILYEYSELDYLKFIDTLRNERYDLVYIYPQDKYTYECLLKLNIPLVDNKICFFKNVTTSSKTIKKEIDSYIVNKNYSKLLELALESGKFSRFKTDEKFEEKSFERLYTTWLNNSIKKKLANDVLIWNSKNDAILGFITYQIRNKSLKIGLIAVDDFAKGLGIGKALVQYVENIAYRNKLSKIEVETQENNQNAYNFYLHIGFKIRKEQPVFHLWMK